MKTLVLGGVHSLLLLLLLGLVNTFWLDVPEDATGSLWSVVQPQWMLWAHIVVSVLVLGFAIVILVKAFQTKDSRWRAVSAAAAVGILLGFVGGMGFMGSGDDVSSFVMALGCVIAIGAYSTGLAKR